MRRQTRFLFLALCAFPTLVLAAEADAPAPVSAVEAPKADARVLRALNTGAERVNVVIGMRDGTPSARTLRFAPDPAGEPARRVLRLQAQKRLAEEMPSEELEVRHFYGSFSLLSGTVTRAAALALANRDDVDWITVDGKRKALAADAQTTQVLIRSDQANARGITGAGQTIAVVDTGVDYTSPAMGGGGFPNAKVVGGTDTADHDSDPMDCEGHGTSVAAIAAGPTGVAPDAKIVAVKVFSSKDATNNSCSDSADDSDILAGVDWAITNRGSFGIGIINLSLGGAFEDTLDHGYCDEDVPDYAVAFDSAVSVGMVVAVASGNDGTANTLSAPACVSSAVSVGAVYPTAVASRSWLDDTGAVQCTDAPTSVDQVICFSDSSTALSLLAPGDFWIVATKGQGSNIFSGTSAASPAAAGALALLRQARPSLSPSALVEVLRATGVPVTDPRNGVTTPRIDTLAAISLDTTHFFPFAGTSTDIPDGTGSATATVTVSGFLGSVAGVNVAVEIDHPDPEQLLVTLRGPDGTTVVLHDHTGESEHPINAVYGDTDLPVQSLGAFSGHNPNGVWTLTVQDTVHDAPATGGRIRSFAIFLTAGQPTAAIPAHAVGRVLPIMAHSQGSEFFYSDLHVLNPGATARDFQLFFVPNGLTGSQAVKATRSIGPGQVLEINDVVAAEYGFADAFGPILATSTDPNFIITGRVYSNTPNGSFGHSVPGFSTSESLGAGGGTATANGLVKSNEFHSNVGFAEVGGAPVQVRVDVLDGDGTQIGTTSIVAGPDTTSIMGDVLTTLGIAPRSNFRANFTVTGGSGRIQPFATYVDDITGDSIFQPAANPPASSDDVILTQSAHVSGARGDFFQTDVYLTNADTQPVDVTISLLPNELTGTPGAPRVYTLAPGQTLAQLDVLVSQFGLSDPSIAGLRVHPSHPARLVVTNNTFVPKFGGTSGYSIRAESAANAVAIGKTVRAIGLTQSPSASSFRSGFGFVEVAGADAVVRVTAREGDTGQVLASKDYVLAANSLVQTSSRDLLGDDASVSNFYLEYTITSGSGKMLAYATVSDNTSGDGAYLAAE